MLKSPVVPMFQAVDTCGTPTIISTRESNSYGNPTKTVCVHERLSEFLCTTLDLNDIHDDGDRGITWADASL